MHAYAVARDMRGAVACVEEMEAEGIVPNAATFSVIISGYGRLGDVKYVSLPQNTNCSRMPFVLFTGSVFVDINSSCINLSCIYKLVAC